jgi:Matrixin
VVIGRLRHLAAAATVLALAATSFAPAAVSVDRAAPASAAKTAHAAAPDGRFELPSTVDPSEPMHWLACRPIEYRINPADMPAGMVPTVRHAMRVLSRQTGVPFRYAGSTTHTFAATSHDATPTVYIAFTDQLRSAGQTFGGTGGEVGVGGPAAAWYRTGGRTVEAITYGRVLLSSRFTGPRTGPGLSWQALILHEVGHALNLAHDSDPASIMSPTLSSATPARYTPDEVRALRAVLQTTGCDYAAWSAL